MRVGAVVGLAVLCGCEKAEVAPPAPEPDRASVLAFSAPTTDFDAATPPPDAAPLTPAEKQAETKRLREEARLEKIRAREEANAAAAQAKTECSEGQVKRQKLADNYERLMLDNSQDVSANARGKCGSTLSIVWIGCDRPFVHAMQNGAGRDGALGVVGELGKTFRAQGFTKISCSDGYVSTITGEL